MDKIVEIEQKKEKKGGYLLFKKIPEYARREVVEAAYAIWNSNATPEQLELIDQMLTESALKGRLDIASVLLVYQDYLGDNPIEPKVLRKEYVIKYTLKAGSKRQDTGE